MISTVVTRVTTIINMLRVSKLIRWILMLAVNAFLSKNSVRCGKGENLALNKPTEQSSTAFDGVSSRAVDGNRASNYYLNDSCIHTAPEQFMWWMVDLQVRYYVSSVHITNRDQGWYRLKDFIVEVSLQRPSTLPGFPGHTTGSSVCIRVDTAIPMSQTYSYDCPMPLLGRYIRLVKTGQESLFDTSLMLCEFEAYSDELTTWTLELDLDVDVDQDATVDSENGPPLTHHTTPGRLSILECARSCLSHKGSTMACRFIKFHICTGTCYLMNTNGGDGVRHEDWIFYKITQAA